MTDRTFNPRTHPRVRQPQAYQEIQRRWYEQPDNWGWAFFGLCVLFALCSTVPALKILNVIPLFPDVLVLVAIVCAYGWLYYCETGRREKALLFFAMTPVLAGIGFVALGYIPPFAGLLFLFCVYIAIGLLIL